jgi:hypothetical protein
MSLFSRLNHDHIERNKELKMSAEKKEKVLQYAETNLQPKRQLNVWRYGCNL